MFRAIRHSSSRALTVFAASGLHTPVATGRSQVATGVCKKEAANTVRAPDDERRTVRNMLSL
jgi:hypothetical protein